MYVFKKNSRDVNIIPMSGAVEIELIAVFNLKGMYKYLHDWLAEKNYFDVDGQGDKWENLYYEIHKPGGLIFHYWWWRLFKIPRGYENNNMFRIFLKINFKTIATTKVETVINGKKFKTFKTDLVINIKPILQVDPNDYFKKHPILKHFQNIFFKRWYKNTVLKVKNEAYAEIVEFQKMIKQVAGKSIDERKLNEWVDNVIGI